MPAHLGSTAGGCVALRGAGGRWQLALAMRQLRAVATEDGGVLAVGEGLPQSEGDLAETGATLEGAQLAEFFEWTWNVWSASDSDLKWFRPEPAQRIRMQQVRMQQQKVTGVRWGRMRGTIKQTGRR